MELAVELAEVPVVTAVVKGAPAVDAVSDSVVVVVADEGAEVMETVTPAAEQEAEYALKAATASFPEHLLVMFPSKYPESQRTVRLEGFG